MTDPRTVAVTGASRGLGAAMALELAGRGLTVGCLSRRGAGPEGLEIPGDRAQRMVNLACDVDDPDSVRAALATLVGRTGGLHALVNNAGIHRQGRSESFGLDDFAAVLRTNALGTFAACQAAHPHLVAAGGGVIVNIGSHYDKMGVKYNAAYAASKAAIGAITRCLAVEWARQGIRVVDVAPGFTLTDLNRSHMQDERFRGFIERAIPRGRPGEAWEVARLVGAVVAEDIPFLTGETLYIDGGQAISN
ncbi:MAG: SDR family oxidoreductase [Thalassobaculum sp.]|uniref:SDR family NAD(P)-dependent oxidoreductase n=1 Tax=Thalassobaculum sp. TaxID=2022740 RepID=UPI0032EB3F66